MQVTSTQFLPLLVSTADEQLGGDTLLDEFSDDIGIAYSFGPPYGERLVTWADLERSGVGRRALRRTAMQNLDLAMNRLRISGQPPALLLSFDGLESSVMLVDEFWNDLQQSVPGELVIGVPARDVVIVTGSQSRPGREKARRAVDRVFFAGDPHPLSRDLLVWRQGMWLPFHPAAPAAGPARRVGQQPTWPPPYQSPSERPVSASPAERPGLRRGPEQPVPQPPAEQPVTRPISRPPVDRPVPRRGGDRPGSWRTGEQPALRSPDERDQPVDRRVFEDRPQVPDRRVYEELPQAADRRGYDGQDRRGYQAPGPTGYREPGRPPYQPAVEEQEPAPYRTPDRVEQPEPDEEPATESGPVVRWSDSPQPGEFGRGRRRPTDPAR
ncbi:DUF1444 family protein [Micromonospora sp. NBC_01796]|uniref:DUF1444 family protein n=1 Tax=Micromonospora sp. NBC_01796 TaxID=2975987 RepID=UPI002DD7E9A5|nr:DUF1444 family protein [Micromonospora sp. NBC_01796]WSA82775.1 DUF1444 family protein [Micromonospora sp. NBC_01796]